MVFETIQAPRSVVAHGGHIVLGSGIKIDPDLAHEIPAVASILAPWSNTSGKIDCVAQQTNLTGSESYELSIGENISIRYGSSAGAIYAVATLRELIIANDGVLPKLDICDSPTHSWRGFMLDESRHFFGPEVVMELLDWMLTKSLQY